MRVFRLIFLPRFLILTFVAGASVACAILGFQNPAFWLPLPVTLSLTFLGFRDLAQRNHSILRSYPISAHIRFLLEERQQDGGPRRIW